MNYHRWEEVGVDPRTAEPNIWSCCRCGLVKAMARRRKNGKGRPGSDIEYSTPEGEVIALNPDHLPECRGEVA